MKTRRTVWVVDYPRSCSTWSEMGRGCLQQGQTSTQTTTLDLWFAWDPQDQHAYHSGLSCPVSTPFPHDLSSFLTNILSPLTGNSDFTVKNSAPFVSIISSEKIQDHEEVESLFTNVPIKGAPQDVLRKLKSSQGLPDRTTLTPTQIVYLLDFALRSTYFQYNGFRCYCQSQHGDVRRTGNNISALNQTSALQPASSGNQRTLAST